MGLLKTKWKIEYVMTEERLQQALALDKDVFEIKDTVDYNKLKEWISVNEDIYTILTHNDKVVGYINCVPVTDRCYQLFKQGKLKDGQVTKNDILPFKVGDNKCLFTSICIAKEYRDSEAIIKLSKGFRKKVRRLKKKSINISSVIVDCVSIDGIKYTINHLNGKYICNSEGGKVYEGNLNPPERIIPKLRYEELNAKNVKVASKIQHYSFKKFKDIGYLDYLDEIKISDRFKKRILPLDYLVYYHNIPVGIVGLYEIEGYPNDIWLNWLAVLPEYRRRGIGTQILMRIIALAREYNRKTFRLYTFAKWSVDAQSLYDKTMQIEEKYRNKEDYPQFLTAGNCKVYSSSLVDKVATTWDNKFINIRLSVDCYDTLLQRLKEDKII